MIAEEENILIVEDNQRDAFFLEGLLKGLGHRVWLTTNGEDAILLVKHNPFAVVVTELHIPGMNGIEITKAVLKIAPFTNVVVMTAYSFIDSAVAAMEQGAYGYITKPFNPSEIRIVLERTLERSRLVRSTQEKNEFAELSIKDALTGVYNRRYFQICVSSKISHIRPNSPGFSLLMVDVDDFKKYNDTQGHLAGDELLRKICKIFQEAIRREDYVFRYGGEEFVLFLDHTKKAEARVVGERICTLTHLYTGSTVSIGVSGFPEDGSGIEELISHADSALYQAKGGGKNRVCIA